MKCYLHIGTEKTATTTIQNFLDLNRVKLLEKGYIYTRSAGGTNNRALSVAAYNLHRRDDFTMQHGIDSDEKLLAFQEKTIDNLKREIKELSENKSEMKILFSSEQFQSRLTQTEEIVRLKNIIFELGGHDISVIVYLRRPAEIASSLYSTAVKEGQYDIFPSPKTPYWNNVCNHKRTIEKFGHVFGKDVIIPKLFDTKEFINGSIIDDFLSVLGISNDETYAIPNNANQSLSMTGVNLLERLNRTVPRWIDDKPNPIRSNLVSYFEKHFSSSKYVMPKRLYEEYDLEFKESNEWVRKKYFANKESLFPKDVPDSISAVRQNIDLDPIADFIADLWNDKQKNGREDLNFAGDVYPEADSVTPSDLSYKKRLSLSFMQRSKSSIDSITYARYSHWECFDDLDVQLYNRRVNVDNCVLKRYQDLFSLAFIKANIPVKSPILEVGGGASRVLNFLSSSYECWNVDKLEGIGNGPKKLNNPPYHLILDYIGNFNHQLPDNYFDFVFSISALEHVPEDDNDYFDRIVDDINRVLKPGGFSLHLFDVIIKEKGIWCNRLAYHIFNNVKTINRMVPFNEMIDDPDLFCMSEAAFNRKWAAITKKTYKENGRPSSLNILWRKE